MAQRLHNQQIILDWARHLVMLALNEVFGATFFFHFKGEVTGRVIDLQVSWSDFSFKYIITCTVEDNVINHQETLLALQNNIKKLERVHTTFLERAHWKFKYR